MSQHSQFSLTTITISDKNIDTYLLESMNKELIQTENKICPICKSTCELYKFNCCEGCVDQLVNESFDEINLSNIDLVPIIPHEKLKQVSYEISNTTFDRDKTTIEQRRGLLRYYKSLSNWIEVMHEINETYNIYSDIHVSKKVRLNSTLKWIKLGTFIANVLILLATSSTLFFGTFYTLISIVALAGLFVIADIVLRLSELGSKYTSKDVYKYPVGKSRVSTVCILVFSILMTACGTYIIIQSSLSLISREIPPKTKLPVLVTLGVITMLKLVIYILCSIFTHPIMSTISIDNLCGLFAYGIALFAYWASNNIGWYFDALGASIISIYILFFWVMNAYENAKMLMGQTAPPELIRRLTYISAHHHPLIINVEQVIAFNVGPKYFAELHVVIPGHIKLCVAHCIGETLQLKVESMPEIDHCWVHVDCENNTQNEHVLFMRATSKPNNDAPQTDEASMEVDEEDVEEINTV